MHVFTDSTRKLISSKRTACLPLLSKRDAPVPATSSPALAAFEALEPSAASSTDVKEEPISELYPELRRLRKTDVWASSSWNAFGCTLWLTSLSTSLFSKIGCADSPAVPFEAARATRRRLKALPYVFITG
jgi:hypothetical protein